MLIKAALRRRPKPALSLEKRTVHRLDRIGQRANRAITPVNRPEGAPDSSSGAYRIGIYHLHLGKGGGFI